VTAKEACSGPQAVTLFAIDLIDLAERRALDGRADSDPAQSSGLDGFHPDACIRQTSKTERQRPMGTSPCLIAATSAEIEGDAMRRMSMSAATGRTPLRESACGRRSREREFASPSSIGTAREHRSDVAGLTSANRGHASGPTHGWLRPTRGYGESAPSHSGQRAASAPAFEARTLCGIDSCVARAPAGLSVAVL
jgi:hypothetical protein